VAKLAKTVRGSSLYAPIRRERLRRLTLRPGAYPDWQTLLLQEAGPWREALDGPKKSRVLVATQIGLHFTANTVDSLLAVALTLRGAQIDVLLCDGALSACMIADHTLSPSVERYARVGPSVDFCDVCQSAGERLYTKTGIKVIRLSQFLTDEDRSESKAFADRESELAPSDPPKSAIHEHALAGTLRFFGRASLPADRTSRAVYARYLAGSMESARASSRLLDANSYDAIIAHHGVYVPQGLIVAEARERGLRISTWHLAYREGCLIFQDGDTYHRAMIDEPEVAWNIPLTADEEKALDSYLVERVTGASDWIAFQRTGGLTNDATVKALGLDPDRPIYALFANVAWDARLHYPASAYGDMRAWAIDTVRWFAARPDRQLVVRCHPGEVLNSPRALDRLEDAIRTAFPVLPDNVRIVGTENDLNSYSIAAISRGAMIFNTKMGMELAARGMPVVVASDAWVRGKGFTRDATSADSYLSLLNDPATFETLTPEETERARRYAWHFFFRRCIPVAALGGRKRDGTITLKPEAASLSLPGRDAGLDTICDGVLNGSGFAFRR
jgi:hypothetical protein